MEEEKVRDNKFRDVRARLGNKDMLDQIEK